MSQRLDELALYYHEHLSDEIRDYLGSRGISDDVINAQQIGWGGWRITIPIRNRSGEVSFFKLARAPQDRSDSVKMLTTPGSSAELYGWEHVHPGTERLIVCEGEFDRLVLESYGFPAVTSTAGALTFRREWADALRAIPTLYICFDHDAGGHAGATRVARMLAQARIVNLPDEVGDGGDVTDFFVRLGRTPDDLQNLLERATSLSEHMRAGSTGTLGVATTREEINELKARVRLESVVARYVELKPKGSALVARCPFHDDTEPSLVVYSETQTFYCFGCRAYGDVVTYLMRAGRLTFRETLDALRRFAA